MTLKKYYLDNKIYNFEAKITSITKNDRGLYLIELNETYFYPEGGGQPGDRGLIGNIKVIDTIKENDNILHILEKEPLDKVVTCVIDRDHREHFMVQHSGQHLISAVLKKELDLDTLSVHLGENETTIEIDSTQINDNDLLNIENRCFELISNNNNIIYHETDDEGLKDFNIRRSSKYSGYIRVVEIEGYDCVPCGGLHLSNISQIGLIKITGYEKIRGNIRLTFLIGINALKDYQNKTSIIHKINKELSTRDNEIPGGLLTLKNSVSKLKQEQKSISEILIKNSIKSIQQEKQSFIIFENIPSKITQKLASELVNKLENALLVINLGENLNWYLIDSSNPIIDFDKFKSDVLPIINGKGGGRSPLWQGAGGKHNLEEFRSNFLLLIN
ncbi:MAG: alanyl-tRNA editing protein [Spirochaetaceae bacterium]